MLEIRNITKIYRSKTGEEVRALDDVSIQFPESGMVFLLGKSGSGKSTLLNVIGGLDSYDSGEFVIMGKSSRDFVGSDFDAYRNTFIGFIFQEYNVLDDFTVGANIGLALELQGLKATNEAIEDILAKVDLVGYAHRKPNELSGGQKQRVAIARALVKDPQIIMADEPTGALDSNTGKQIFDALKELSREKLVLIVSHDRDFAEKYADRIIELSDGRVIEDVTKHEKQAERISDGVHRINDHILRIERGYQLTAKDLEMINTYLAQNGGDVLLSGDNRVNDELRSAVGISKEGASTVFEGTDKKKDIKTKQYDGEGTRFIRSRLPMKNAVKMGSSGLKHKKFRLFMTILLSFLSFAMFGLASTVAAYEQIAGATASMMDSNVRNASITASVRHTRRYTDGDDPDHWYNQTAINDEDIAYLKQQTGLNFVPVFTGSANAWDSGFSMGGHMSEYRDNEVYTGEISGFVSLSREEFDKTGYTLTGKWPEAKGEVVITEHLYRQFNEFGFKNNNVSPSEQIEKGMLTTDESANGILGKHLSFETNTWSDKGQVTIDLKIVGVVNTNFDYDRYANFMPADENAPPTQNEESLLDMVLANELEYEIGYGFHALAFATMDTITELAQNSNRFYVEVGTHMGYTNKSLSLVISSMQEAQEGGKGSVSFGSSFSRVAKASELASLGKVTWLDGRTSGVLADDEVLIPAEYKHWLEVDRISFTLKDAHIQQIVAIVGAENWAASEDPAYDPNDPNSPARNFYDRLEEAMQRRYIDDCLADVDIAAQVKLDAAADYAYGEQGGNVNDPKAYWTWKWFQNDSPWYCPSTENSPLMTKYSVFQEYRVRLVPFFEALYGVDFPADISGEDCDQLIFFFNDFYANDLTADFSVSDVSNDLRDVYTAYELRTKPLADNLGLVQLMIDREYNSDLTSMVNWNNASEGQRESWIQSFYRHYYVNDNETYESYYGKPIAVTMADGSTQSFTLPTPVVTMERMTELAQAFINANSDITPEQILAQMQISLVENNSETQNQTVKVEGLKLAGFIESSRSNDIFVSNYCYNYYTQWESEARAAENKENSYVEEEAEHAAGIWGFAIAPMPQDEAIVAKLAAMHYAEEGEDLDVKFEMNNAVMATLGQFDDIIEVISQVFVWVGLALAVFSSFLLMNFISTSISYKKREIGILRAVGARSSDVFKIFFSEAFIIALINFVLATAASLATVIILNTYMRNQGINITLLSFGILQVVMMLGISILVAAIASFLPVYGIARKKPVDAIKDR